MLVAATAATTATTAAAPAAGRAVARWRPFGAQDRPAVIYGRAGTHLLAAISPAP